MKQEHFEKSIAKNILEKAGSATAWTLLFLLEAGALTVQSFLSSSLYADFPNAGLLFDSNLPKVGKKKKYKEITIRQSLRRLEKYGFVEKKSSRYVLTKKGGKFMKQVLLIGKNRQRVWDKKYRVVVFDIPEKKREARNWLRGELYFLEYKKLQNSVFISKYPLPDYVIKEIKKRTIGNYVNYLLVDKVFKNIV